MSIAVETKKSPHEQETWDAVVGQLERLRNPMRYAAYRRFQNHHDAEDIGQETALQALTSSHMLRDPMAAGGFIWRIFQCVMGQGVRAMVANRKAGRVDRKDGDPLSLCLHAFIKGDDPETKLIAKNREAHKTEVLNRAAATLRPRERAILSLNTQGHDAASTTKILGLTDTQYRLVRSRGKQRLERYIQKHQGEWN